MKGSQAKRPGAEESLFWSESTDALLERLGSSPAGLAEEEAARRLQARGAVRSGAGRRFGVLLLLASQFRSPIVLILLGAAVLSAFVGDAASAAIILGIVLASGLLGFWQEKGATDAVRKLLSMVQVDSCVLRHGARRQVPSGEVVPGDIVVLAAGDSIPGDCRILSSTDLHADEATLTGETYPVEKGPGTLPPDTPLARRTNALFAGTHVVSGEATAVVVATGKDTQFGKISESLRLRSPETEFERGLRRFGYLLVRITLLLVLVIFAVNVYFQRPVLDSFLFSLALAVGLTPQLLPAITSITLASGARSMAREKVIVRRLSSIEDFGAMNVLCSDKTGTLTEGAVRLHAALDLSGEESEQVLFHARLNACYETGYLNPIDEAIRSIPHPDVSGYEKLDEVPYDFVRKRLSILVSEGDGGALLVSKGALESVLAVCSTAERPGGKLVGIGEVESEIRDLFRELSENGFRVLGVACRRFSSRKPVGKSGEDEMTFLGFLVFGDPPKEEIAETIGRLEDLGCSLKIVTGDNRLVAASIAGQIGLRDPVVITGGELNRISDAALPARAAATSVFAEVEPNQKERIILALKKGGNVVGYLGDGINDAPALHAADAGISVDTAADVAKEAADLVLLQKDLAVLERGIREGRKTFANTLKYVFMATSANFGNMFSMAGASLFLPFLPLLPAQVLLTNFLTDLPEMTIATDSVDGELVKKPRRWDVRFIRNFMLTFGLVSSVFDYLTFGILLLVLHASVVEFRTGWFLESVVSATMIVLVVRTRRLFFRSRPSPYLALATAMVAAATVLLPFTPLAGLLGFTSLPLWFLPVLAGIVALYVLSAEAAKRVFYRKAR
ncbi:MAG: magnesium-translocating P-type ATPase [Rubrobacteraceae bacterium]|nr:magnesium-translocating P-type ATPase [Rubrobacteraceae bacterium]